MGHAICAFLTPTSVARELATHKALWFELRPDLALVSLTEEVADRLGTGPRLVPFYRLSPARLAAVRALGEPIAYIETDYHGGHCTQCAGVWTNERTLVEPHQADGAVNTALRALGVVAASGKDEWDTIGLTQYRDQEDIRRAAVLAAARR